MDTSLITVEALRYTGKEIDLRTDESWSFALDQRAFGPRRLLVVTADRHGRVFGLSHCERTDPPEFALECCLDCLDDGAAAAVAYSDEPVASGPPPPDLADRFLTARGVARRYGVHLVDWIVCDDTLLRSMRFAVGNDDDEWWDVPNADPGA